MNKDFQALGTADDAYAAWALYTGPAKVTPLWTNSRWIAGEWNGGNRDTTAAQIKNDIDARLGCIMKTFAMTRAAIPDARKEAGRNYFVIPEFFFHSRQGPYPYLKINGAYPFEYICTFFQDLLSQIQVGLLKNEAWLVCIGSIMTCNVTDINGLLASSAVKERLDALNAEMKNLSAEKGYKSANDFHKGAAHIKAFSYLKTADPVSDAEKAIDDLMNLYRANPLCIVRNRGAIFNLTSADIACSGYEKQCESTVDLTMGKLVTDGKTCRLEHGGMITEWAAGYPSISILNGDKNCIDAPLASRISVPGRSPGAAALETGVEICLDHRLKRLRRTVGMIKATGAAQDNPSLAVQLVPSGGMQLLDYSVSAGSSGAMFNSDGCDPILTRYDDTGKPVIEGSGVFKQITAGVYASSAQTMVQLEKPYYSHSQLSFRYGSQDMTGYNNASGTKNDNGPTCDPAAKKNAALDSYPPARRITVTGIDVAALFAAGPGELHLYVKA